MCVATVGILARIDLDHRADVLHDLNELAGVETFEAGERGQLGILVEAASIDDAPARITNDIEAIPGVLCAWPVYVHLDDDEEVEPDEGGPADEVESAEGRPAERNGSG